MNARSTSLPVRSARRVLAMLAATTVALTGAVVAQTAVAAPAQAAETTYTHGDGATITYNTEVVAGEPIVLSGTGWMTKPDFVSDDYEIEEGNEGSIIGVKFMPGGGANVIRDPKPDNPYTGDASYSSPDVWHIIQAAGTAWEGSTAGSWTETIDWPSAENGATNPPDLQPGDTFGLQFLSGTLYGGNGNLVGIDPNLRPDVSRSVNLTFTVVGDEEPPAPLTVSQHPAAASVASGAQATFTAATSGGFEPVTVQWQRSTTLHASVAPAAYTNLTAAQALDGSQLTPTLVVTAGTTSMAVNNRWYRAVFTDAEGNTVTTDPAKLSIVPLPAVTQHPNTIGQTIDVGDTATFTAEATSTVDMTVQWQSTRTALANGEPDASTWAPVDGATGTTLTVTGADAAAQHGTFYRAAFTNASGTAYSYAAELRFFDHLDTNASVEVSGESYGPITPNQPFSVSAPNALVQGEPIVIEGTGYLATDGTTGSVANFMVDASYSGDPNTLNTTRNILNPVTGATFSDKRSHGIVQANADGTWRMEIPWPDENNTTRDAAFFETNWKPGTQHIVRILTGSLLTSPADYQRGISVRFTIVDEATAPPAVAPELTTQPAHATVEAGADATFTAAASGTPAPTVQWESSTDSGTTWVPVVGATAATLTVADTTLSQTSTRYRAVFTNAGGSATSNAAGLAVTPAADTAFTYTVALRNGFPAGVLITPKEVEVGAPITVSGTGWFKQDGTGGSGGPIFLNQPSGGTGPVNVVGRTIENQLPVPDFSDARAHGVFQSDASGAWTLTFPFPTPENSTLTAETAWAAGQTQTFRVLTGSLVAGDVPRNATASFELVAGEPVAVAPAVATQPSDVSVEAGQDASFTAAASGDPAPTVQWESSTNGTDWAPVVGATEATLILGTTAVSQSGTQYRAVFTNAAGSATTDAATLTVTEPQNPSLLYTPVLSGGQPAGTLITPREVVLGESITISGTGWLVTDGSQGSGGPVFINQPSGGTGPVTVVGRTIENQIPGSTYSDARAHGAWKADANGDWTITIPFPAPENSSLTAETAWQVGQEQTIRILTGSLVSGDRARTVSAPFTIVADDEEPPSGAIALTNDTVEQYGDIWFDLSGFVQNAEVTVELVNGAGDTVASSPFTIGADGNTANPDGQTYRKVRVPRDAAPGADYAVRVVSGGDVLATSGPVTVTAATTRVFNPGDHAGGVEDMLVQRGGTWTFHAVGFEPNGTLTATAEVDGETVPLSGLGQIGAGELAWQLDANGDTLREPVFNRVQIPSNVEAGDFAITFSDGVRTVTRTVMVEVPTTASVTVDQSAELGGTIRVTGTGFMHPNGAEGSTIAIKINDGAYSRVDTSLHQNKTIWWIVEADEFGGFSIDMPVPNGTTADDATVETLGSDPALVPGDGFTLRFLTGSLKDGDQSRTLQSTAFTVTEPTSVAVAPAITAQPSSRTVVAGEGASFTAAASGDPAPTVQWESSTNGTDWAPVVGATEATLILAATAVSQSGTQYRAVFTNAAGSATTDAATLTVRPQASVTVATSAELGDTLRVTGEGFFHPSSTEQGSRIGIKIDAGAFQRLDTSVHANKTIWAIVNAQLDGTFEADIQLPDGTTEGSNGSAPAFTTGSHTLTLLTGSLLAGDTSRTVVSDSFTVTSLEPVDIAPAITTQPSAVSVVAGQSASFTAAASGTPAPTVQWESSADGTDWTPVTGATEATLALGVTAVSQSGTQYRAVFTNSAGSATTNAATLTVTAPPMQPTAPEAPTQPTATVDGSSVTVNWTAPNDGGSPITGYTVTLTPASGDPIVRQAAADATSLVIAGVPAGTYTAQLVATNAEGSSASSSASAPVTVAAGPVDPNPKPNFTPEPPVQNGDDLPAELEDEVTVVQNGDSAIVTVPGAEAGEWFFVYAYSTPTPLGWYQAGAGGSFAVDLSSLSPGEHRLAVLNTEGALVGWGTVTIAGGDTKQSGKAPGRTALENTGAEAPMQLAALAAIALLAGAVTLAFEGRRRAARRNAR